MPELSKRAKISVFILGQNVAVGFSTILDYILFDYCISISFLFFSSLLAMLTLLLIISCVRIRYTKPRCFVFFSNSVIILTRILYRIFLFC